MLNLLRRSTLRPGVYICRYANGRSIVSERVEIIRVTRSGYVVEAYDGRSRITFAQADSATWTALSVTTNEAALTAATNAAASA